MHVYFSKALKSFALHLNICPMRACLTARQAAFTFFLFVYPYYFVMLAQKKSKQPACSEAGKKRPVQKKTIAKHRSFPSQNAFSIALIIRG